MSPGVVTSLKENEKCLFLFKHSTNICSRETLYFMDIFISNLNLFL